MTRRALLRALAGLAAFCWAGAARDGATAASDPVAGIAADLRGHFEYLRFESGVIERYARLYVENYGAPDLTQPVTRAQIHSQFLLSTDFFQNGADEGRTAQFVALYDPYVTPCYNPFF